jgi:dCTP deaminase
MILPGQTIRRMCCQTPPLLSPFVERGTANGKSYGLSVAGYDIRIRQDVFLRPGDFALASTVEKFHMPDDVLGLVKDKSSWARSGLSVFNTVIEPGWSGFLTLELVNHSPNNLRIAAGDPIAQVLFQELLEPAERPYAGKYQDQEDAPVAARHEP